MTGSQTFGNALEKKTGGTAAALKELSGPRTQLLPQRGEERTLRRNWRLPIKWERWGEPAGQPSGVWGLEASHGNCEDSWRLRNSRRIKPLTMDRKRKGRKEIALQPMAGGRPNENLARPGVKSKNSFIVIERPGNTCRQVGGWWLIFRERKTPDKGKEGGKKSTVFN